MKAPSALTIGLTIALSAGLLLASSPGCSAAEDTDPCLNSSTFVGETGARHVLAVDLPFTPGPVAVVSSTADGYELSGSSRLWLGEEGTTLYALRGPDVQAVDLATWDTHTFASVGYRAAQLAGSDRQSTLVVTDPVRGSVWIMDSSCEDHAVEVEVGRGPEAVALGPGRRIAYVANEWDKSLSLVDTGVGSHVSLQRRVVVASRSEGKLLVLDGDGRVQQSFEELPGRLQSIALLQGGQVLAVSYSDVVVTGDIEVPGDGEVVLSEGVALLDLESGDVTLLSLPRPAAGADETLARPTGLAVTDGGTRLVVALPGWGRIATLDIDPESAAFGSTLKLQDVPGNPSWVVAASLDDDWVYLLDDDTGSVVALDTDGQVIRELTLR